MSRTTYRVATRQYDGGAYLPHEDVLMSESTAKTLAKAMSAQHVTMVQAQTSRGAVIATYGDEVEFDRMARVLAESRAKAPVYAVPGTTASGIPLSGPVSPEAEAARLQADWRGATEESRAAGNRTADREPPPALPGHLMRELLR